MASTAYEEAVIETFGTKPLRTVLLIDDEFPTFVNLAEGEAEEGEQKFKQKDRAVDLYRGFRDRDLICDVENDVGDLDVERFRKSDLVILDYHLGPGENDTGKSIELLRQLASSKHFNTVIVYTAEADLAKVWLDIMSALSGGWTELVDDLKGEACDHWHALSDKDALPKASREATMQYVRRRMIRQLESGVLTSAIEELEELGVSRNACSDIIRAMIHRELGGRAGQYAEAAYRPTVGNYENEVYWMQTENSFVCILQKTDEWVDGDQSKLLMSYLSRALCAWHPNLVQILISEIQNVLELEALASADELLKDPITQTALWYYLLTIIGCVDPRKDPDIRAPLIDIVDKVVDGVRQKLATDEELLGIVSGAVFSELMETGWTADTWPKSGDSSMLKRAKEIARTSELLDNTDVLFRLNSFFSTEPFRSASVTNGTICWDMNSDKYVVIASPACDLVARRSSSTQKWSHAIHPLTPIVGIWLEPESVGGALSKAQRGHHIFLESESGKKAFNVLNGVSQPSYEFFFAMKEGRVHEKGGMTVLDVARIVGGSGDDAPKSGPKEGEEELSLERNELAVIGQLRDMNATRVLHLTGQHLSRIGLDFLNMPS